MAVCDLSITLLSRPGFERRVIAKDLQWLSTQPKRAESVAPDVGENGQEHAELEDGETSQEDHPAPDFVCEKQHMAADTRWAERRAGVKVLVPAIAA